MAGEIIFYGATVETSPDGTTWTEIPAVTAVTIPEPAVDKVETTSLDNASNVRTYRPGLKDLGDWTITQNYTRAAMTDLEANANTSLQYRITLDSPDGGTTTGDVILITDASRDGSYQTNGLGELVTIASTLIINSVPTWTAGA